MDVASSLFLTDILRIISDALLAPVMIILIILIIFGLWSIGTVIAEYFTERRNYRISMPELLEEMACAEAEEMSHIIAESGLLRRQKTALLTLWDFRTLPEETFVALAKRIIATEDLFYRRKADWQASASKIAPMFGLMGTLIPLGPGIVALGQNNIEVLAASIGTAFYTTVAGLVSAAVFYVISKVRQSWYEEYMTSLETAATTIIEVVEDMRAEGGIDISEPGNSVAELGFTDKKGKLRKLAEEVASQSAEVARRTGRKSRRKERLAAEAAASDAALEAASDAPAIDSAPAAEAAPAIDRDDTADLGIVDGEEGVSNDLSTWHGEEG